MHLGCRPCQVRLAKYPGPGRLDHSEFSRIIARALRRLQTAVRAQPHKTHLPPNEQLLLILFPPRAVTLRLRLPFRGCHALSRFPIVRIPIGADVSWLSAAASPRDRRGLFEGSVMGDWKVPGYVETKELGHGASGRVVMAIAPETGAHVAIKYLSPSLATNPSFIDIFRSEASLLGELDSPYVVRLHRYIESNDGAAIVMELVEGPTLRAVIQADGALEPEAALTILKGSLIGLSSAHAVQIVHRDYKPENVLLTIDGISKLADFGIATNGSAARPAAGTPYYMAPEQWRGEQPTYASDVYAATVTFFECVAGKRPFHGDSLPELALQHTTACPPLDQIPAHLRPLIMAGMAKDPLTRPATADAFLTELEKVACEAYGEDWEERGRQALAAAALALLCLHALHETDPSSTTSLAETTLPNRDPSRRPSKAQRALAVTGVAVGGLTVLALFIGGAGGVASSDPATSRSADPASVASPASSARGTASLTPSVSASASRATPTSSLGPHLDPSSRPTSSAVGAPLPGRPASSRSSHAHPVVPSASTKPAPEAAPLSVDNASVQLSTDPTGDRATALVRVTANSRAEVVLRLTWYRSDTAGPPRPQDGDVQIVRLQGKRVHELTIEHEFDSLSCPLYWGLQVQTTPAAPNTPIYSQSPAPACAVPGRG